MRTPVSQKFWIGGCNSFIHPTDLRPGQYAWGENVVNRGGIIQTSPGKKVRASIAGSKLQGLCFFTPRNSDTKVVAVVDGKAYFGAYPDYEMRQIQGLNFDPYAEIVHMEPTVRSAKRNADGSIALITPSPTLMFTDGAGRVGCWDGITARHLSPNAPDYGPPAGCLWSAWSGSRWWVAVGNRVVASDIVDPLSFSENQYLAERSNFDLPGDCTGLKETASSTGLLAFTKDSTTAFKSYIYDRTVWTQTQDFQKVIIPGVGCVAGRSLVNQYGETYWMTDRGLISLNAALHSQQSSSLDVIDGAMMRSKRCLSPNLGGVAGCAFENYLLMSAPYADRYNGHTWVLDQVPINGNRAPAWNGVWSGVRPAQWATGKIGGKDRCFFASYDKSPLNDTHIHIWEAFQQSREDEGGAISCQVELAPVVSDELISFKYCEIEVVELLGDVVLDIFVGGTKGPWVPIGTIRLQAEKGSMGSSFQRTFTKTDILKAFKPQARTVRSQELVAQGAECNPESENIAGRDKGFSILLEWRGRMGIREVRVFYDGESAKPSKGGCHASEGDEHNAVTERGEAFE